MGSHFRNGRRIKLKGFQALPDIRAGQFRPIQPTNLLIMGTRLDPVADQATLEALCGAPAGAWEKMEQITKKYESDYSEEAYKKQEAEFDQHSGTRECYDFQLYGWGKLNAAQYAVIEKLCPNEEPWGGSTTDPKAINALLMALGKGVILGGQSPWNLAIANRAKITGLGWG
jgi:hypothetical protein